MLTFSLFFNLSCPETLVLILVLLVFYPVMLRHSNIITTVFFLGCLISKVHPPTPIVWLRSKVQEFSLYLYFTYRETDIFSGLSIAASTFAFFSSSVHSYSLLVN